ncbi:hypothetical protein SELMODRAFT_145948 [Selaginella moellendorffii]|uniref:Lipase n=1 Tax=Selaginella moellendorffii TaxID=88036 RepID=D8RCK8_SELML|nr:triacylglycerol lipase 1 [Selaginella moellendorffii]EFJ30147.1 hypothetical protein SELMODRAFT_145948 [Selaginella moellendorffii]|eukprot:XP_002969031.1 triacylglycerol lipase 1 [Selaginella moellendorffii]
MEWMWAIAATVLLCLSLPSSASLDRGAGLCSVFVRPFGYPCLEHKVTTLDGFHVAVQRIPYGVRKGGALPRPAVLLQHGLLQGGDTWFLNPPSQSLGFILADEGFDVWISNGRGTYWSRGHETLSIHDKKYWDWSWDELAEYDIPAILEFIHSSTSSEVFYVGHSQGTIIGLAALTSPKTSRLVSGAAFLSPITYLDHITSKLIRTAAFLYIDAICNAVGLYEFNLHNEIGVELVDKACADPEVDCGNLLAAITGPNCCFNVSRIPYYLQYEPQSTSLKNMQHLAQMIRKGTYERFDYGWVGNLRNYRQLHPPKYDIATIPALPVWMAYGGKDCLSDTKDVAHTLELLTCNPKVLYVEDYAHLDFILSTRARDDVYNDMIAFLKGHFSTK